jgi:hypothetical protein
LEKGIVTASFPVSERNKVRRLHERGRLAGFTPGRRLDEVMSENYRKTYTT